MTGASQPGLPLVAKLVGQVVVITIGRPADLTAAEAAAFGVDAQAALGTARQAVFDLASVAFIDSSGLGVLVSLNRFLGRRGGELKLAGPNRDVYAVFEMVRLHRLFEIHPSLEDALDSFRADA